MAWTVLALLLLAIVLWLLYEWMEHSLVQYSTTIVECQEIPQDNELRLCLISDLHNNRKNTKKLSERIMQFAPDAVLLAGDLVNKHKTVNKEADKFLSSLAAPAVPTYYSAGNHELSLEENFPKDWKKFLNNLPENITYLDNRSVLLPQNPKICISGLSLPREFYKKGKLYNNPSDLPDIDIPEHEFHILLAHHPEYAFMYGKYKADFIVSGHLHGGLLRLPLVGGLVSPRLCLPDCDAGLKQLSENSSLFVSRGLGSHTIPLRFFNRVEVNFIILKNK